MATHMLVCRGVTVGAVDVVDDPFAGAARLDIDVELDGGLVGRASATTLIEIARSTAAAHAGETGAMIADAVAEASRRETGAAMATVTLTLSPTTSTESVESVKSTTQMTQPMPEPACLGVHWVATSGETTTAVPTVAEPAEDTGDMHADMTSHRAVVSMESVSPQAAELFRDVIVTLDGAPGTHIAGISPLYHAMTADGGETRTAVAALDTTMGAAALTAFLNATARAHDGDVELHIVDIDDADGRARIDDGGAGNRAAILAPWMDMDPNATFRGDPLAYLLANAPDTPFAGLESDRWIIGGAQ